MLMAQTRKKQRLVIRDTQESEIIVKATILERSLAILGIYLNSYFCIGLGLEVRSCCKGLACMKYGSSWIDAIILGTS